jgi:hypothetical protein
MHYPETQMSRVTKNQRNAFATSMNPDQPAHSRSLISIHAVRYQFI